MINTSKFLVIFTTLISGSSAFGGIYYNSRQQVWNEVKNYCLPAGLDEADTWKLVQNKLKNDSQAEGHFKSIKERIGNNENGDILKEECIKAYKVTYKDMFSSDNKFLEDVKKYCHLSFKDKLKKEELFKNSGDLTAKLKEKESKLSQASENEISNEFKKLKNELKDKTQDNEKENHLKEECGKIYNSPYTNPKGLFEDFKNYCIIEP